MRCDNRECKQYSDDFEPNCKILRVILAKEYCKHYKEPVNKLREKLNGYLTQYPGDELLTAIVDAIEELQK